MRARLIAALLAGGDDAALCHASALVPFKVLASVVTIKAFAARHRGERGAPAIRRVAGEPHTRSGHERKFRRFLSENELPPPMSNHPIGPCCADFYWPQYELVIEFDEDGHKTELAFEEDPARDRYFVGLGLRVMRVTEQALRDESVLRQEVRRAARIVR